MIYIGNHVSVSKGYLAMGRHESSLGGNTFAFFPRNPRGGRSKDTSPGDIASLRQYLSDNNFGKLVVHGAYTMNICAAKEEVRANSREMLRDDLLKLQTLPGNFYNFHPGCHVGQGIETAVGQIAEALADLIREVEEASQSPLQNKILLETMAGKGSEVGGSFEQLREIIDRAAALGGDDLRSKLGVCLDTCHIWDAGYDIQDDLDGVLREFDAVIGLDNLCAVHLNDSKNERGSRKDRHEKLGQGIIGADALRAVVRHPLLQNRPFILETPNDDAGYKSEIETVISWMI
ncbi:MAG: deoxyribonuclease IV [Ruminococcus sp.]|nr:deoxyribonuclease IV [Ruminococcus sp.]